MSVRTGFLARGFSVLGPLSVSHGLGNPGVVILPPPIEIEDREVAGARAPRAVVTNKEAPKLNLFIPKAKKEDCE